MSDRPRIAPGTTMRELGPFAWGFSRLAGRVTRTGPPNIFTTIGRHPRLFRAWLRFAGKLMPRGTLPRRDTELVILRVAHVRGSAYEFDHHVRLGRRAGIGEDDLRRIMEGPGAEGLSARDRTLLTAVDELHESGDLTDATWSALTRLYDERGLIELLFLAGHYEMLAIVLNTLRVQPDGARSR
jgi:alkylhydroperoxidase family enzyme